MVKIMKYRTESIVKCSIVQYNTEKYITIKCNSWQTVQYNIERYTTMEYIRVHNNTVGLCTMLYNVMYRYSKVWYNRNRQYFTV